MRINNMINSPTNPIGWTSFTTVITASGSPDPTPNTTSSISYYLQIGKTLYIKFNFKCNSGGGAGSGFYMFSLPSGFTINTSIVPSFASAARAAIGSGITIYAGSTGGLMRPYVFDSTTYLIVASEDDSTVMNSIGSAFHPLSANNLISVSLETPIL